MNEIYWITRLDGINVLLGFLLLLSSVVFMFFLIGFLVSGGKVGNDFNNNDFYVLKTSLFSSTLLSIAFIFTPSEKDMFMIYGIGGTIDYIKSNETAKQLPDKCIQALDKFVDEYMLNEEDNKENKDNKEE